MISAHKERFYTSNNEFKPIEELSVKAICGDANQVMIYGWEHCLYAEIGSELSKIFKVLNYRVGDKNRRTLEGHRIERVAYANGIQPLKRSCKAGLVNMVFENYKRSIDCLPLIPILFIIDIDQNPHPISSNLLTSRLCNKMTVSELRRAYKLCNEFETGDLIQIGEIARRSIKFVKLTLDYEGKCKLEELPPFWKADDWDKCWKDRKETVKSEEKLTLKPYDDKTINWREELTKQLRDYHQLF